MKAEKVVEMQEKEAVRLALLMDKSKAEPTEIPKKSPRVGAGKKSTVFLGLGLERSERYSQLSIRSPLLEQP